MIQKIDFHIDELSSMKKYPNSLFFNGDIALLKRKKISIIGSRKPNSYTKSFVATISSRLAKRGVVIVSGAAMGVDAIAHRGAGSNSTIAVLPNGLNLKYPAVNKSLIEDIELKGLTLSQFDHNFRATPWSFVVRNELVVALGDILIVAQADLDGGSMRSVEFALSMKKEIYVLPHRLGESDGTNLLLNENKAKAIYDIDDFVSMFGVENKIESDPFLLFCKSSPTYDQTLEKFGDKIFEYELDGKIEIIDGVVVVI